MFKKNPDKKKYKGLSKQQKALVIQFEKGFVLQVGNGVNNQERFRRLKSGKARH